MGEAMRKKAFLWDFDGVLVDSMSLHVKLGVQVCREQGIQLSPNEVELLGNMPDMQAFGEIVNGIGKGPLNVQRLAQAKEELYLQCAPSQVGLMTGALEFLHQSRELFPSLALVTSNERKVVHRILRVRDLFRYFDVVVTGDDCTRTKPDPEPYQHAIRLLGVEPAACIALEDTAGGVQSARAAGCSVIGILTTHTADVLASAGAQLLVSEFREILPLINWGIDTAAP